MALWLPKWLRDEQAPPEDETRRTFLFLSASALVVAAAPSVELFDLSAMPRQAVRGFTMADVDRLLRESFIPYIRENMNNEFFLTQYLDDGEPVCGYCSALLKGALLMCPTCGEAIR